MANTKEERSKEMRETRLFFVPILVLAVSCFCNATDLPYRELGEIHHRQDKTPAVVTLKEPAKRGEHIINNNIRRVYKDIVNDFLGQIRCGNLNSLQSKLANTGVLKAVNEPLPQPIGALIEKLVVHISGQVSDDNSVIYGQKVRQLRNSVVNHMVTYYHVLTGDDSRDLNPVARNAREIINQFVAAEHYIDKRALSLWKPNQQQRAEYEQAKKEVENMFLKLEDFSGAGLVTSWVRELRDAVKSGC
ncbi:uncharacterized protein [Macrobrachium rosenbergii]|uniref:uncharacterized protein isoform X1 n=1 Tax=Macrobrachium rosenbergii TaxID=79674 RepID=UPI0034D6136F